MNNGGIAAKGRLATAHWLIATLAWSAANAQPLSDASNIGAAIDAWYDCLTHNVIEFSRGLEDPETIVKGAYGLCLAEENRYRRLTDSNTAATFKEAFHNLGIGLVLEARSGRRRP